MEPPIRKRRKDAQNTIRSHLDDVLSNRGGVRRRGETTTPAAGGGATDITLLAQNVAFDLTELSVPAGEQIAITFENRDAGIRHNLLINGPSGPIATDVESGPVTQTLTFTIDEAGTYKFLCEVHPSVMVGELVVGG